MNSLKIKMLYAKIAESKKIKDRAKRAIEIDKLERALVAAQSK